MSEIASSTNLFTLGRPERLTVEFGRLAFGAEPPAIRSRPDGLAFLISEVIADGAGYTVFGLRRDGQGRHQVWRANTLDGLMFTDAAMLYELPDSPTGAPWLAGSLALRGRTLYLLQSECGTPPTSGHPFHVFSGNIDGGGWRKLNDKMVYRGQDAFTLLWNERTGLFINYQTSYQSFDKRYADNMPGVRRVQHIRTSPDCLTWTPGGSFGVTGPHLPDSQLIVPDHLDTPDTEFYHFAPVDFGEFWAGTLVKYISQPPIIEKMEGWPHGPFLGFEWWISTDGFEWSRPFREHSGLDNVHHQFPYRLTRPIVTGDQLRWPICGQGVYTLDRKRMFYVGSRANAEVVTPVLTLSGNTFRLEVGFEPGTRNGYLMAELLDASGSVLPGFEREKSVFKADDRTRLALDWGGLPPLAAGTSARLRLCFRETKIYSVSY